MAKYCAQCLSKAAGIPCEEGTELCVALDSSNSKADGLLLRIRVGAEFDADEQLERLRSELLEAADILIDSVLGDELGI